MFKITMQEITQNLINLNKKLENIKNENTYIVIEECDKTLNKPIFAGTEYHCKKYLEFRESAKYAEAKVYAKKYLINIEK